MHGRTSLRRAARWSASGARSREGCRSPLSHCPLGRRAGAITSRGTTWCWAESARRLRARSVQGYRVTANLAEPCSRPRPNRARDALRPPRRNAQRRSHRLGDHRGLSSRPQRARRSVAPIPNERLGSSTKACPTLSRGWPPVANALLPCGRQQKAKRGREVAFAGAGQFTTGEIIDEISTRLSCSMKRTSCTKTSSSTYTSWRITSGMRVRFSIMLVARPSSKIDSRWARIACAARVSARAPPLGGACAADTTGYIFHRMRRASV